jgi:hypothetical protein
MEHIIFKPRKLKKRIFLLEKYIRDNCIVIDKEKSIIITNNKNIITLKTTPHGLDLFTHSFKDYTIFTQQYSKDNMNVIFRTFKYNTGCWSQNNYSPL